MNKKCSDLLDEFGITMGILWGAVLSNWLGGSVVIGGCIIAVIIVLARFAYHIRRPDATNDRSTSQDVDV